MFGEAILIDCHSMPHEAIDSAAPAARRIPRSCWATGSAPPRRGVVERVEAAFRNAGLRVVHNTPFAGAYTAQHYGRPSRRQHVVQIEIDRSLYMNERDRPNAISPAFKAALSVIA
jgi:N-formylglutamate amidohydrolase